MLTDRFYLRKMITIIICLVGLTVFMGCDKEDKILDSTQLLDGWEISKSKLDIEIDPHPCDIYFINAETGYFVGYWGEIYKTTNAGISWQKLNSETTLRLYSVFFLDENTGFVSGRAGGGYTDDDNNNGSPFLKTIDGGKTWEKRFFEDYTDIRCLHFFDNLNGLAIIHTYLLSSEKCFVAKTSDGGINWTLIELNIYPTYYNKFYCFDNVIYISGENQKIFKSKDYGNTWETIHTPLPAWNYVRNMYFVNENVGYIDGISNIYKTIDGGLNWEVVDFPFSSFGTLHFYNETEGFNIVDVSEYEGGDFPTYKGCIGYQTYDGGATWEKSALINSYYWGLTYFVQSDLGYGINLSEFFTIKRK